MRWIMLGSAMVACLVLLAGTGMALLPNFTKEELIVQSESIVLGTVSEITTSWAADHSGIFTYVTLQVEEQFKGQPAGNEIVLQIPGGKVGEITQVTSDTPEFQVGSKYLVHLYMQDTGSPGVYGWEKGALPVEGGTIPAYGMTIDQFNRLVESTTK